MHLHVPEALAGIVADIKAQKPDHIALTGDLVNISLPTEFSRAAEWLAALGGPHDVTVIPGNHDVYVATAWPESLGLWGAYMAGDGQPPASSFDVFPTLRRRGPLALVGLSSGVPKPPLFATGTLGEAQIAAAERMLADLGREGLCRIVLIHHPPLTTEKHFKRLTDASRLPGDDPPRRLRARAARPQSPQRSGAHRRAGRAGARDRRHLGFGGAGQQVRPRALSLDSHRARERGLADRCRIARPAHGRRGLRARWRPRVPQRPGASPW